MAIEVVNNKEYADCTKAIVILFVLNTVIQAAFQGIKFLRYRSSVNIFFENLETKT